MPPQAEILKGQLATTFTTENNYTADFWEFWTFVKFYEYMYTLMHTNTHIHTHDRILWMVQTHECDNT